jgi:hypothetical protein
VSAKRFLLSELKRRKVFRVGAACLVVGWLLIQVASTVAPQLNLPGWVPRAITFLIAMGFSIALILSWIFDVGPGGIHREATSVESASSASADVVSASASPAAGIGTPPEIPHKSIAVLPFADLSPTRDQEYFSDGMVEEILPGALPYTLLLIGDGPRALDLCQRFRSTNNVMYLHRLWSPSLRALRGTPQFRTYTRSVGLTALRDHHGAPDGARRNAAGEYVWE